MAEQARDREARLAAILSTAADAIITIDVKVPSNRSTPPPRDVRLLRGRNGRPEREDAHAVTQQGRARSLSGEVYRVRRKTRHRHRS